MTATLSQENEKFMIILARLKQWKEQGAISPEQQVYLTGLCRGEPLSVFLELNILLYAGVLAFVAGLGWTVTTWSQQLGAVLVVSVLSAILAFVFGIAFHARPTGRLRKRLRRMRSSITCFTSAAWSGV